MLHNQNIIVLDLETLHSADDCRHCSMPKDEWDMGPCVEEAGHYAIGWNNKPALGLSIGCYWDYRQQRIVWFDAPRLGQTLRTLVETQPLMVSFNGISFDFPLMRGILRRQAEFLPAEAGAALVALCDGFKDLAARSYDLLVELWKVAPADKFSRGLNSLDAIATANGLGGKTGRGAEAPRDWAAGKYADVLNYCQNDVYLTKCLFEMVICGQPIHRRDRSALALPLPTWGVGWAVTMDPTPAKGL